MSLIDALVAEISAAEEKIVAIQKSCAHPEEALTRTPSTFRVQDSYEEDQTELTRYFDRSAQGERICCGLCYTTWNVVEGNERPKTYYNSP